MIENRQRVPGEGSQTLPGADRTPVVTYALLGVILVVFLVMTAAGGTEDPNVLLSFGAMFGPLIATGEYWRLFTAMFLHIGVTHLVFNGLGLFIFGHLLEKAFGPARFLAVFILAGLLGSAASYALNTTAIGAGASGAIFGVLGALAAFFVVQRKTFGKMGQSDLTAVLFLAAINLIYGFATPGIDNWAHLGGFVGGVGLGAVLAPRYSLVRTALGAAFLVDSNSLASRFWVVPATLVLVVAVAWSATASMPETAYSHVYSAERYYMQREYDQALAEIERALDFERPISAGQDLEAIAQAHLLRGRIYVELGNLDAARSDLAIATRLGDRTIRAEALRLLVALGSRR